MRDNISLIFAVLFAVFVLIILPLISVTSRQDSISYNKVLALTTNFVDDVRTKGYLTEQDYTEYLTKLALTSNTYKVEMEYHEKMLIKNIENTDEYVEDTMIYYNKFIVDTINPDDGDDTDEDVLKLAVDDEFYVKVYNTNITTASLLYNFFARVSIPEKIINIGYGGKVSHSSGSNFIQTNFESAYTPIVRLDIVKDDRISEGIDPRTETTWSGIDNDYISTERLYFNTEKAGAKLVVEFTLSRFAKVGAFTITSDMFTSGRVNKDDVKNHIINYLVLSGELKGYTVQIDPNTIKVESDSEEGLQLKGTITITGIKLEEGMYRTSSFINVKPGLGEGNTGIISPSVSSEEIIMTRPQPGISIRRTNAYAHELDANEKVEFEVSVSNIENFAGKTKRYKLISVSTNEEIISVNTNDGTINIIDGTEAILGTLTDRQIVSEVEKYTLTLTINKLPGKFVGQELKLVIETELSGKTIKGDSDKFVYTNELTQYNIKGISYAGYIHKGNSYTSNLPTYTINQGEELKIKAKITLDNAIENEADKQRVNDMVLNDLILKDTTTSLVASTTISITKSEVGSNYVEITFSIPNDKAGTISYYLYNKQDESVKEDSFSVEVKSTISYTITGVGFNGGCFTSYGNKISNNEYEFEEANDRNYLSLGVRLKITPEVIDESEAREAIIQLIKEDIVLKNITEDKTVELDFSYNYASEDKVNISVSLPVKEAGVREYYLYSKKDTNIKSETVKVTVKNDETSVYGITGFGEITDKKFLAYNDEDDFTVSFKIDFTRVEYYNFTYEERDKLIYYIRDNLKLINLEDNSEVLIYKYSDKDGKFNPYFKTDLEDMYLDMSWKYNLLTTDLTGRYKLKLGEFESNEFDIKVLENDLQYIEFIGENYKYATITHYDNDWQTLEGNIGFSQLANIKIANPEVKSYSNSQLANLLKNYIKYKERYYNREFEYDYNLVVTKIKNTEDLLSVKLTFKIQGEETYPRYPGGITVENCHQEGKDIHILLEDKAITNYYSCSLSSSYINLSGITEENQYDYDFGGVSPTMTISWKKNQNYITDGYCNSVSGVEDILRDGLNIRTSDGLKRPRLYVWPEFVEDISNDNYYSYKFKVFFYPWETEEIYSLTDSETYYLYLYDKKISNITVRY